MEWSLGKRIKMARIERGISQQQLARDGLASVASLHD